MSYTAIYRVSRTSTCQIDTIPNSYGFAPVIWNALSQRYLGWDRAMLWGLAEQDYERLWRLDLDDRVPYQWRVALVLTFDNVIVEPADIVFAVDCLRAVGAQAAQSGQANSLVRLAEVLASAKPLRSTIGFGISPTSVSDQWAGVRPERISVGVVDFDGLARLKKSVDTFQFKTG